MSQRPAEKAQRVHRAAAAPSTSPTFASVFVDEYTTMVALAAAVSGDRVFAEDIAQEAMTRLEKNWDRVQGFNKPGAWLRRVTINLAISQRRRRASELKALLRLDRPRSELPTVTEADVQLWEQVAALPKMQRAVISLQYLEDLTTEEIAEILEIEPTTVRVHQHRARQRLLEALGSRNQGSRKQMEEER